MSAVTDKTRLELAASASGLLNFLVEHPEFPDRERRLRMVAGLLDKAVCGSGDEVLAAKAASGVWGPA